MDAAILPPPVRQAADLPWGVGSAGATPRGRLGLPPQRWALALIALIAAAVFAADLVLPRGETAAIGYCLIPVVAADSRRRGLLLGLTAACTALTWAGLVLEPPGGSLWESAFDRLMVTGVLWLTLLLVWQRASAMARLALRTEALQRTTRELERSNEELEHFASTVAHDVRSPLHAVGLAAHLLSRHEAVRSAPDCEEWVAMIGAELARMDQLVKRLLAYGRVGSGGIEPADCDCQALLSRVLSGLAAELADSGGRVTSDPLPSIRADPPLVAELFQNLVENAIKYRSDAPPHVHVSAAHAPGGWRFSFRDNGIGVKSDDVARIFEPFRRGHGESATRPGVGLGLATCRRVAERHGGWIRVEPSAGRGATFVVFFPDPAAPPPAAG
jgi:signal transduction histidine kinase